MKKSVSFVPVSHDPENYPSELTEETIKKTNVIIYEVLDIDVKEEYDDYFKAVSDIPTKNLLEWNSYLCDEDIVPVFPLEMRNHISGLSLVDVDEVNEQTNDNIKYQKLYVSYFYDGNSSFRGESSSGVLGGLDVYLFEGFTRKEVEKCVQQIAEYWKLLQIKPSIYLEAYDYSVLRNGKLKLSLYIESLTYRAKLVEIISKPVEKLIIKENERKIKYPMYITPEKPSDINIYCNFTEGKEYCYIFKFENMSEIFSIEFIFLLEDFMQL